jgi:hypothetical protein
MRRATELPGEGDGRPDEILTLGRSTVSANPNGSTETNGGRVTNGARSTNAPKGYPITGAIRAIITVSASHQQQYVGQDVTVTGKLVAEGAGIADASIKLYLASDGLWTNVDMATTSESGEFKFQVQQPSPGTYCFKVVYPGNATYEPSISEEMVVTYVTIPTAITAAATPQQQCVGQDVTVTGRLTAEGAPLADAPVTLYNSEAIAEGVPIAATSTDAAGSYQFTLTEPVATSYVYRVGYAGDSAYAPAQSTDVLVHYATLPAEAAPVKARYSLNLKWYEVLSILLILAGESLLFLGHQLADVAVQAVNVVAIVIVFAVLAILHGE